MWKLLSYPTLKESFLISMGECFSDIDNDAIDRTYFSKENMYPKVSVNLILFFLGQQLLSVNLIHIIYLSSLS